MSAPMYLIVGRLRRGGEAVLRTAYSPIAYKAEIAAMTEYRAVTWQERETLSLALPSLPWLTPPEQQTLAHQLTRTLRLF